MKKYFAFIGLIIVVILSLVFFFRDDIVSYFFSPRQQSNLDGISLEDDLESGENEKALEIVAENLNIPWEVVFLPDGDILVTQRSGELIKIGNENKLISKIQGVEHVGEGGLMGMALHPNFEENRYIYLYLTSRENRNIINRVERYKLENDNLSDKEVILDGIGGATYHDGGRIKFGPDGYLYITTGDAGEKPLSQDRNSLNGKILRVDDRGNPVEGNPFGNEVYSLGHRNPQGITWDDQGRLWSSEHGPSGLESGNDEINLIEKGGNYGWPLIVGDQKQDNLLNPAIHSGSDDTWAPAGIVFLNGKLFFTGLRGSALYEVSIEGNSLTNLKSHFTNQFGRLRAVTLGPDGYLYITTSNKDGRGTVKERDDKLIRINPDIFSLN